MNRRLNLDIPQNNTFLLPRDVLAATDQLIGMKFGTGILDDDDMNHLKNKRIRSVADLLQDQFGLALGRFTTCGSKTIRRVFIRQSKPTPQTLRVIRRNNNLAYLLKRSELAPADLVMCQEKLVQEAVDTLLDSGSRGQPTRDGHNKVYKSLSDVIEGKEGRFRETLLGKRVDYSGHSVIVVGPSLSLHQCGLPLEIAIKLFQLFVIRDLIKKRATSNVRIAKRKI
ncbi:hypothetical protein C2845_PM05G16730 [Panicum miliaceum]|uniref:DNA-directed RNA polymerase subunit n=1 Tax=Panicum miliaceum TaxID=4540 RepID=A0A3L6T4C5_PANMI|nr:hypothetical protein C2845_PM05G16730 [Panicum miliaceum]